MVDRRASIVTDRLALYGAVLKELGSKNIQKVGRWLDNLAESRRLVFRRWERAMNKFKLEEVLQEFTSI